MLETRQCPFCGLMLIKDDEALTIAHEAPECAKFEELAKKGNPEIREVRPEALVAHFVMNRAFHLPFVTGVSCYREWRP